MKYTTEFFIRKKDAKMRPYSLFWWRRRDLHSGLIRFIKVFYILIRQLILVVGLVNGDHKLPFDFNIRLCAQNQTHITVPCLIDALSFSDRREKEERSLIIKQRMQIRYCLHLNLISVFNEAEPSVCLYLYKQRTIESKTPPCLPNYIWQLNVVNFVRCQLIYVVV